MTSARFAVTRWRSGRWHAGRIGALRDWLPPRVTAFAFDGIDTVSATVSEAGDWYWLVSDNASATAAEVIAGGGLASGRFALAAGANSSVLDLSSVAPGDHYLHGVPVDAAGNVDDAQVQSLLFSFSAAGGLALVKKSAFYAAAVASAPQVLAHDIAAAGNVLVARVAWESAGTSLDTSVDAGGANIPTFGGAQMTPIVLGRLSRRHCAIFAVQAASAGSADFSISPANGIRSMAIRLDEYTGVDAASFINAAASATSSTDTLDVALTTTGAGNPLLGVATFGGETSGVTVSNGTFQEGQATGADLKDIWAVFASATVASAGAGEGLGFSQLGNLSACAALCELKPAV